MASRAIHIGAAVLVVAGLVAGIAAGYTCQRSRTPAPPTSARVRGHPLVASPSKLSVAVFEEGRKALRAVIEKAGVASPGRGVFHLSYTCDLRLGGERYPVFDLFEDIRKAGTVSGVGWIVVLSDRLQLVQKIRYDPDNRPLSCHENELYVEGTLNGEVEGNGNELVVLDQGRSVVARVRPPDQIPAIQMNQPSEVAPDGSEPVAATTLLRTIRDSRADLLRLVKISLPSQSTVTHVSHTCNLRIGGQSFPIVDLHERRPGREGSQELHSILVYSPNLTLLRRIRYAKERPMLCHDNRLYLAALLEVPGVPGDGNELIFTDQGRSVSVALAQAEDMPTAPLVKGLQ